jgi:hypothetical protein
MSDIKLVILFIIAIALVWGTVLEFVIPKHGVVVYDCRLSEISPDFPVDVKNACRKLNSGRI